MPVVNPVDRYTTPQTRYVCSEAKKSTANTFIDQRTSSSREQTGRVFVARSCECQLIIETPCHHVCFTCVCRSLAFKYDREF